MQKPKRPNLFIIGAMKSGTSSLHYYLNAHPSIFLCEPKEPCYFVYPNQLDWLEIKRLKLWESERRYLELFKSAGDAEIVGEASTLYTKAPKITDVVEKIARFNRDARFIYIMRDPIKRTISHYWHEVRRGNEYREMLAAIQENPQYLDVSNYPMQLTPYFERFGRAKVLTLTFEEMVADPAKVIRTTFEWLGVDSSFQPLNTEEKIHVTPQEFYQKNKFYRLRYAWPWNEIASLLPKRVRSTGLQLAVKKIDRKSATDSLEEVIDWLRPIQLAQIRELSQMLGRDFPQWRTLCGDSSLNSRSGFVNAIEKL